MTFQEARYPGAEVVAEGGPFPDSKPRRAKAKTSSVQVQAGRGTVAAQAGQSTDPLPVSCQVSMAVPKRDGTSSSTTVARQRGQVAVCGPGTPTLWKTRCRVWTATPSGEPQRASVTALCQSGPGGWAGCSLRAQPGWASASTMPSATSHSTTRSARRAASCADASGSAIVWNVSPMPRTVAPATDNAS